jgi:hypothetical protein
MPSTRTAVRSGLPPFVATLIPFPSIPSAGGLPPAPPQPG